MSSLAYRPATAADMALVLDSFVDSYRTAHAAGLILMDDWREVMWRQFERILARPGVATIVAYHPGAEPGVSDLYGWIAVAPAEDGKRPRPKLVLYVYVKEHYRRMGIARGLLRQAGLEPDDAFEYAAKTAVVSKLRNKLPCARWNPLRARFEPKTPTPAGED